MSHRYPSAKLTLTAITYSGHILEKGRGGREGRQVPTSYTYPPVYIT